MLSRLLLASFGAVAITLALLMFMHRAADYFSERQQIDYFQINDFIPGETREGQRPPRPPTPQRRPELPPLGVETTRPALDAPVVVPDAEQAPRYNVESANQN